MVESQIGFQKAAEVCMMLTGMAGVFPMSTDVDVNTDRRFICRILSRRRGGQPTRLLEGIHRPGCRDL